MSEWRTEIELVLTQSDWPHLFCNTCIAEGRVLGSASQGRMEHVQNLVFSANFSPASTNWLNLLTHWNESHKTRTRATDSNPAGFKRRRLEKVGSE